MKDQIRKLFDYLIHLPELAIVFFTPIGGQFVIILLAVITDTASGIWVSRKENNFSSRRLADVLPKLIVYTFSLLTVYTTETIFSLHSLQLTKILTIGILGIEMVSIDENFKKVNKKGLFGPIINKLKRK